MGASLIQYRGFIWNRARADLRHRYAGTGLGLSWNVLHPLASILIYSAVFTGIFTPDLAPTGGPLPYTFYLCSGFFPWVAFSESLVRGSQAFLANANYLKKLPIPEQVFVAQVSTSSTLTLMIGMGLLLLLALLVGHPVSATWLLLPLPLLALQLLGYGCGLLLGTLNVFFRDVGQWVIAWLPAVMWTAPIVYPAEKVKGLEPLFAVHPLVPSIRAVRDLFVWNELPPAGLWLGMLVWPAIVLAAAHVALVRLRDDVRDVL